jgi:hypothetical protein
MVKNYSDNCIVCANEFEAEELFSVRADANYKICTKCLAKSDPQNDYAQVRNIVSTYLKFSQQQMDAELASPDIKIEPGDTFIQKAVDMLKRVNPNYFVGVRKIEADMGEGLGHVASGPGQDPAVIHINLPRIRSELQAKLPGVPQEQFEKEFVRQIALTIAHEKGHVGSFKPEGGFAGGESPAEQEASSIMPKIDSYYNTLK